MPTESYIQLHTGKIILILKEEFPSGERKWPILSFEESLNSLINQLLEETELEEFSIGIR